MSWRCAAPSEPQTGHVMMAGPETACVIATMPLFVRRSTCWFTAAWRRGTQRAVHSQSIEPCGHSLTDRRLSGDDEAASWLIRVAIGLDAGTRSGTSDLSRAMARCSQHRRYSARANACAGGSSSIGGGGGSSHGHSITCRIVSPAFDSCVERVARRVRKIDGAQNALDVHLLPHGCRRVVRHAMM